VVPNPCPSSYAIVSDHQDKVTCPVTHNMSDIHSDKPFDSTFTHSWAGDSSWSSQQSQQTQRRLLGFLVDDGQCTSSTEAQLVGYYLAVSVFAFCNLLFTSLLKSLGRCQGAYCAKDRCKDRSCCGCCVYCLCKSMGHTMLWLCVAISLTFGLGE
jgi:hypothetical protein